MFERFLHQTPFFRLLLPFITGIVFQINFTLWPEYNLYILSVLLVFILLFAAFRFTRNYRLNKVWGVLVSLFLFSLGIQLVTFKQQKEIYFGDNEYTFLATITEPPEEKENSVKTTLKINSVKDSSGWKTNHSLLLCYFEKDSSTLQLQLGDQIITSAYINTIKHSGNPFAFNYKKYLTFKEIYNQCYIQSTQYKVLAHNRGSWIRLLSSKTRQQLLKTYQQNQITGDEFAVLSALTLGYKNELTPELKESFSTSGAMHILAVSGLHVGIIYIILCKFLFFLQKNRYGKIIQSFIIIAMLFFYAFLTGLSDSVMRATIMFTFISLGQVFTRQINIYNSIAASAFILLFTNPYSVMSVGFQLSYSAVLSIVFFQPKIYSLMSFSNRIADYTWQLVSVAVAAQIGTFPITIHYFNQFPAYFILTNIMIIPLATFIIYGAFVLFIFSFSHIISHFIAQIIHYLLFFLNTGIGFIESLPGATINGLIIDNYEVVILLIFILSISFFIISKRIRFLQYSMLFILIFVSYNIIMEELNSQKSVFTVHHTPGMSAVQFIKNNNAHFFYSPKIEDDKNVNYNIKPIWEHYNIKQPDITQKQLWKPLNYFSFNHKRVVQIKDDFFTQYNPMAKLKTDYLILSDNIDISVDDLSKYFDFDLIIFDTSNSYYTISRWEEECKHNGFNYYNMMKEGAFIEYL